MSGLRGLATGPHAAFVRFEIWRSVQRLHSPHVERAANEG